MFFRVKSAYSTLDLPAALGPYTTVIGLRSMFCSLTERKLRISILALLRFGFRVVSLILLPSSSWDSRIGVQERCLVPHIGAFLEADLLSSFAATTTRAGLDPFAQPLHLRTHLLGKTEDLPPRGGGVTEDVPRLLGVVVGDHDLAFFGCEPHARDYRVQLLSQFRWWNPTIREPRRGARPTIPRFPRRFSCMLIVRQTVLAQGSGLRTRNRYARRAIGGEGHGECGL